MEDFLLLTQTSVDTLKTERDKDTVVALLEMLVSFHAPENERRGTAVLLAEH